MSSKVDHNKCIGCGDCLSVCPVAAIKLNDSEKAIISNECIDCGACVEECREQAIDVF
jgi:ferredoxin